VSVSVSLDTKTCLIARTSSVDGLSKEVHMFLFLKFIAAVPTLRVHPEAKTLLSYIQHAFSKSSVC